MATHHITAEHCVSFARARLPICENRAIEPKQEVVYVVGNTLENSLLRSILVVDIIVESLQPVSCSVIDLDRAPLFKLRLPSLTSILIAFFDYWSIESIGRTLNTTFICSSACTELTDAKVCLLTKFVPPYMF